MLNHCTLLADSIAMQHAVLAR